MLYPCDYAFNFNQRFSNNSHPGKEDVPLERDIAHMRIKSAEAYTADWASIDFGEPASKS